LLELQRFWRVGDFYRRAERFLLAREAEHNQKLGFSVVGVVPDANGLGKPDILMAKRVQQ
jgi:aminoglycoside 6'-N-acetyltransferase I